MIIIEKAAKVYSCCGQYIAISKDVKPESVKCPRCGHKMTGALRTPTVIIATKK